MFAEQSPRPSTVLGALRMSSYSTWPLPWAAGTHPVHSAEMETRFRARGGCSATRLNSEEGVSTWGSRRVVSTHAHRLGGRWSWDAGSRGADESASCGAGLRRARGQQPLSPHRRDHSPGGAATPRDRSELGWGRRPSVCPR